MAKPSCEVCGAESYAKGWCRPHYRRWERYGDPRHIPTPPSHEELFWAKVDKTPTCWLWTGSISKKGYGTFGAGGRSRLPHRVAYELLVGPIPDGLTLDHLCRVRHCVNPDHLEPVTGAENTRRGLAGAHFRERTHCPQGHAYDEENTGVGSRNQRICRACQRVTGRAWRERYPDKVQALYEKRNEKRKTEYQPREPATHCPKGHPYSDENTFARSDGRRGCRACRKDRQDRYNAKRRTG